MADNTTINNLAGWEKFVSESQHKSDRSAALLGAVYLDSCLGQLIASFLVDDPEETAKLLDEEKPLGNFQARARAAYCLGLISTNEYHDIKLIIEIRNRFANQVELVSFTENGIRENCYRFKIPREMLLPGETRIPRRLFVFTSTFLTQHLALRSEFASKERRRTPDEFMIIDTD
jgi:DNA-binding MltR family transcriptional regulator